MNKIIFTELQHLRLDILVGMLNGSFPWEKGAYIRSLSDEELQKVIKDTENMK